MAHRKKHRKLIATVSVIAALALFISINSLLPSPLIPTLTWNSLLEMSGLSHTVTLPEGELQVHFIDVGNADATLVRTGEYELLIDAGEPGDSEEVIDYLQAQGVSELDMVIATHPDADHIGGMADVLEQYPPKTFLMSFMDDDHTPTSKSYERLLTTLDEKSIPVTEAAPGQQYTLGEAVIDILAPLEASEDTNNMSVVSRITFGEHRFLMMGDAEKEVEATLLKSRGELQADVLKVGHHGSHSSTGKEFLQKVSPAYAFIPCGADNRYGHPHNETLDTLMKQNVTIYRADTDGTVVFESDGQTLSVREDAA